MNDELRQAAEALLPAPPTSVDPVGQGHINSTHRVGAEDGSMWCLQRLNPLFADERLVMHNVEVVVSQLRRRGQRTIELAAHDGQPWFRSEDGRMWRAYRWIEGTTAADHASPDWVAIGRLVGSFVAALSDLDDSQVVTVVDRFHAPVNRWQQYRAAVAEDSAGRLAESSTDVARLRALAERVWAETPATKWEELPRQVVHNDTKSANVVVSDSGDPLLLIDLDTAMMGSPVSDLGELTRCCRPAPGGDAVRLLADVTTAFLHGLGRRPAAPEWEALPVAGAVLSFENAVRALTDHLAGDRYYDLGEGVNQQRFRRHAARAEELLDMAPSLAAELEVRQGEAAPSA